MQVVRKPKLTEVIAVKQLLDAAVEAGDILPRELPELYENVRDFYVYVDASGVGGCVALHIDMVDLAEVRSLVVRDDLRKRGVGKKLLAAALEEAQRLDIVRVYAFTRVPDFFARNGFRKVPKEELPYKVFKDCMRCSRFRDCDEIAMIMDLTKSGGYNEGEGEVRLRGTLGFMGCGNMGTAILEGLITRGMIRGDRVLVYDPDPQRAAAAERLGARRMESPELLARESEILILAVKPQIMEEALGQIRARLKPTTLVISIAAGISIRFIQQHLGTDTRVIRVMPNTPALVQAGAAGLAFSDNCSAADIAIGQTLFEAVGVVEVVRETDMDAVTALSGSGPAYFFYMTECLIKAGITEGLDEAVATRLAAQTLLGAGKLLAERGESAALLREKVTSKGGTTEAALAQFHADRFEEIIRAGVRAAAARSRALGSAMEDRQCDKTR